jgi:hypothetical protein
MIILLHETFFLFKHEKFTLTPIFHFFSKQWMLGDMLPKVGAIVCLCAEPCLNYLRVMSNYWIIAVKTIKIKVRLACQFDPIVYRVEDDACVT